MKTFDLFLFSVSFTWNGTHHEDRNIRKQVLKALKSETHPMPRVAAVKKYRELTGAGLSDAVTYVKALDPTWIGYYVASGVDAIVADKDKTIADLKRQLEDARDRALEEAAKIAAPYHTGSGNDENGCPHLCSLCRERRTIRGAIRALKSNQK